MVLEVGGILLPLSFHLSKPLNTPNTYINSLLHGDLFAVNLSVVISLFRHKCVALSIYISQTIASGEIGPTSCYTFVRP